MVNALLNISDNANRVLNTIKARNGYKDKSEAVEYLVDFYIEEKDEYELRPEFIEKIKKIEKEGKFVTYKDMDEFARAIGLKNVHSKHRKKTGKKTK